MDFEEAFRKITSGEAILFNEKYISPITINPFCKLIYCLNEFPAIEDSSNAFYRRMILVPFDVEFNDENKDVNLKKKLELELAIIFRWCVQGYNRLKKQNGFSNNIYMKQHIHEIKTDNNPVIAFAQELLNFKDKSRGILKRDLYNTYKDWAKQNGHGQMSFRKFNNRFYGEYHKETKKDYRHCDTYRNVAWPGITYQPSEMQGLFGMIVLNEPDSNQDHKELNKGWSE
jgi:putative DNA primase/helicase